MAPPYLPGKRKRKSRSLTLRLLGYCFGALVVGMLVAAGVAGTVLWNYSKDLPDYESLAKYEPPVMTRVHAGDGSLIAEYAKQKRIFVPISAMPKRLINAFLAAEDHNFYSHWGIDLTGIARAAYNNITKGKKEGASTITQQVAKNFLLTNEQSMDRKIKEAILATRIEQTFSKDTILELYLNEIYLGLSSYGVAAASLNYFGKELHELNTAECAYLAALPKKPSALDPIKNEKEARIRRNWVIGQMLKEGYIDKAEHAAAIGDDSLGYNPPSTGTRIFAAEFFAEDVRRELISMYGEEKALSGGLSVRTTLDPKYQRFAKEALVDGLVKYDRSRGWRGPVKQIDLSGAEWGEQLLALDMYRDIDPWKMAVVLEVGDGSARLGLRPERSATGAVSADRKEIELTAAAVKWALKKGAKGLGGLLAAGDVVYVVPGPDKPAKADSKEKDKEDAAPAWQLMQIPQVEGALVAMDPHTGRVLSLVGGFSFYASQFDRATQARRQPGSAFKPFVYATAMDNGYTPSTVILDAPIVIDQGNGQDLWKPENYSGKIYGPSTLRTGIEFSRNLMTVRLAQDVGMPLISDYARRFGIYDNLMPVLSMALGAGETSLMRLTTGYAIIANGGRQVQATLIDRIQDRHGKTIWRHDARECQTCAETAWTNQIEPELTDARKQVIDPHTAYQITSMMEGVIERGTATALKVLNRPIAGKTGTTNEAKDAWFVAFTPDLVVGVFIGYDNPQSMGDSTTGGALAAPVVQDFFQQALGNTAAVPFRIPPGIKLVRINRRTGARAVSGDPDAILEAFKPDTDPPDTSYTAWDGSGSGGGGTTIGTGNDVY
jgi:penicillin-binding protein 1A